MLQYCTRWHHWVILLSRGLGPISENIFVDAPIHVQPCDFNDIASGFMEWQCKMGRGQH